MHVALLGNHVLPLRLGEPMRITSVLRRTALPAGPVTASAVTLRAADVLAVLALAAISAPTVLAEAGLWVLGAVGLVLVVAAAAVGWLHRLRVAETAVRLPGGRALAATGGAWVLEAAVVWEVARVAGLAAARLGGRRRHRRHDRRTDRGRHARRLRHVRGGRDRGDGRRRRSAGAAFAVALTTHAVKTGYALVARRPRAGRARRPPSGAGCGCRDRCRARTAAASGRRRRARSS